MNLESVMSTRLLPIAILSVAAVATASAAEAGTGGSAFWGFWVPVMIAGCSSWR
jgi:hypothetical protein